MKNEGRKNKEEDSHSQKNIIDRRRKHKIIEANEEYMRRECHEIEEFAKRSNKSKVQLKIRAIV